MLALFTVGLQFLLIVKFRNSQIFGNPLLMFNYNEETLILYIIIWNFNLIYSLINFNIYKKDKYQKQKLVNPLSYTELY